MTALRLAASAIADTSGKITFEWPPVSLGYYWYVAVVIPDAPSAGTVTVQITGESVVQALGSQPSPGIEVRGGSRLIVKGVGFDATTPYTAYAIGRISKGTPTGIVPTGPSTLTSATIRGPITISSGKVTVSGGQLTRTGYGLQYTATTLTTADLGNGTTGTVTITADATRTSDMNAKNLTVKATVTLHTGGYRILVQETAQITGTVSNAGTDAPGPTTGGRGAPTGTLLGGGNGTYAAVGGNAPATTNALSGGHGGKAATGHAGGDPSSTTRPPASISISYLRSHVLGGGGGGGGTGSAGAGGGGGGGLWLAASTLAGSGTSRATGGNATPSTGSEHGGGGGGGAAIVACRKVSWSGTVKAAGGSSNGQPGTAALLLFS